jgi:hypothetical protein
MTYRMRSQQEVLKECRVALEKATSETLERSEIEAIIVKMDSESVEFQRRFGPDNDSQDAVSSDPVSSDVGAEAPSDPTRDVDNVSA